MGSSSNESAADTIEDVSQYIAGIRFSSLPDEVVEATKKFILDTVAVTFAGSSADGVAQLVDILTFWGGRPESRVAFFGHKLPAHHAVIANVTMSHALEIDDGHYPGNVHPTTPTLWSGLATADAVDGISGADLLLAVAVGVDLMVRIGLAAPRTWDFGHHTALYSGFGAAAVSGKMRGLSPDLLQDAFGITLSQTASTVQAAKDAALVKRMQPALSASNGMRSVIFAQHGITGSKNVFDGECGLFRLFNQSGCDRAIMLEGLGKRFHGRDLSIKRYPSSRCAHAPIEGTIELVVKHDLQPDQIEEIQIEVAEGCRRESGQPYDPDKGSPQVNAQFNIPFNVAAAVKWRDVFVDQIQGTATRDPEVLKLSRQVIVKARGNSGEPTGYLPVGVRIRTRNGEEFNTTVTRLKGSPELPMSWDEIVEERVKRCVRSARQPIRPAAVDTLISTVRKLEELPDARQLMDVFL